MLSTARDSDGSYVSIIYDLLPHSIVAVGGGWAGKQQQLLMEVLWLKMNKGNFLVVFVAFSSILSLIGSLHGS